MNNFDKFKLILQKRVEKEDEDYIQIQKTWNEMIEVFSSNIEEANKFLMTECTADEFSTLSEVFDEIAEKTKSLEFIETLEALTLKFPEETKKYNILSFIDSAKLVVINQ